MTVIASAASSAGLEAMPCCDGLAAASVTFVSSALRIRGTARALFCRGKPQSLPRGLTGADRPLYSAGFATPGSRRCPEAPVAELVDALELKIEFRKECWFDSGQGHHTTPFGLRVARPPLFRIQFLTTGERPGSRGGLPARLRRKAIEAMGSLRLQAPNAAAKQFRDRHTTPVLRMPADGSRRH